MAAEPRCQTPSKTQTTERQTDGRQESKLVHFSLKCDIWWQYFNDFPDNQLTKIRVFIRLIPDSYFRHLKFIWSIALCPPIGWMSMTDTTDNQTDRQTNKQTCLSVNLFVCLFVCVLDGVWHLRKGKASKVPHLNCSETNFAFVQYCAGQTLRF